MGLLFFAVELQNAPHKQEKKLFNKRNIIHNFADCAVFGLLLLSNRLGKHFAEKHFQTTASIKAQRNHLTLRSRH